MKLYLCQFYTHVMLIVAENEDHALQMANMYGLTVERHARELPNLVPHLHDYNRWVLHHQSFVDYSVRELSLEDAGIIEDMLICDCM